MASAFPTRFASVMAAALAASALNFGAAAEAAKPKDNGQATALTLQESFSEVAEKAGPAVVGISTEQIERVRTYFRAHPFYGADPFEEFFNQFYGEGPTREFHRFGLGSGVVIDPKGLILTNEHVVSGADRITITFPDGREFEGEVTGTDPRSDLAIVRINADGEEFPWVPLGDSDALKSGQWAIALGNPFGLMGAGPSARAGTEPTLTVGVISAMNRQLPYSGMGDRDYSDLIQTDAAINPGNSGGPLLDIHGRVIGINVAILGSAGGGFMGIGFAIPINRAKRVLEFLVKGEAVEYGWLGVQIQEVTEDVARFYADQFGIEDLAGALIFNVVPQSPAAEAGLRPGDIILEYNGEPVRNSNELVGMVNVTETGGDAALKVLRDGETREVAVKIGRRPTPGVQLAGEPDGTWRGLHVEALSSPLAERYNLPGDMLGVIVAGVEEGSPAARAGFREGDIITEINRSAITSVQDFWSAVRQIKGDALIRTNRGYVVLKAGG